MARAAGAFTKSTGTRTLNGCSSSTDGTVPSLTGTLGVAMALLTSRLASSGWAVVTSCGVPTSSVTSTPPARAMLLAQARSSGMKSASAAPSPAG